MPGQAFISLDSDRKQFGERLAKLRRKRRLTQLQLGTMINMPSPKSVKHYEQGQSWPSLCVFVALAAALRVSMDELWYGFDSKEEGK